MSIPAIIVRALSAAALIALAALAADRDVFPRSACRRDGDSYADAFPDRDGDGDFHLDSHAHADSDRHSYADSDANRHARPAARRSADVG